MDIGIFKASKVRLVLWIVIPPLLIVTVGLSSYALQQRAEWKLQETQALSNVLPDLIEVKQDMEELYDKLGLSSDKRISTGDELVSILEKLARKRRIELKRTQIVDREQTKESKIPVVGVIMDATGDLADFQLFLNDITSAHPLVSTRSISVSQVNKADQQAGFELKVVFDLLMVNDVLKASGG